ncbi:MAG: baseplate J/gp47 family protein [Azoarcus sp.]|jgi:uncharacterized phage protein gp47/JayE|nr:baseplate J/gp47 family protein [Azoarcus sp.]
MPGYSRPSLSDLDARIAADLAALPEALREALSHTWARACHGLHGHLEWLDRQCNPLTCELERLYDWAALYNVARLDATPAAGTALASGAPGSVILADTLLRGPNRQDYRVLAAQFTANTSVATVSVRAVEPGDDGNLPPGAQLTFIDPQPGIAGTVTVGIEGITGGAAEESVDDWRLRVADEWQVMTVLGARGGRIEDYRYWARSAHPSVSGALVFPHALGPGSVVVYPICNGAINRQPTPGVLAAVGEYYAAVAPATADWRLAAPLIRPVTVRLQIDAAIDNAANRERIAAAIGEAIFAEQAETSILYVAAIDAAIATVSSRYVRLAPMENVAVSPGEVLVFADLEWV